MTSPSDVRPRLSVIIPAFDCADLLDRQLAAVAAQHTEDPWDVLVGDNGSHDHIAHVVDSWRDRGMRVRLVDASARRGPAAARNIAVRQATAEALVFTDADDVVEPGWLAACAAGLAEADVVVGSLDYRLQDDEGPSQPQDPWPRQFGYLPAGLGANLAVRRSAYEAVGGFDEALQVGEDIDLCWRLQLAGYRFRHVEEAVVRKSGRESQRERSRQSFAYGRGDPLLYRRFRGSGMPRATALTVKSWAWLVLNVLALASPRHRSRWLHVFFLRLGRLVGSIERGVVYL